LRAVVVTDLAATRALRHA